MILAIDEFVAVGALLGSIQVDADLVRGIRALPTPLLVGSPMKKSRLGIGTQPVEGLRARR